MPTEQETLTAAAKAVIDYDVTKAEEVARSGLDSGVNPVTMLEQGFIAGITEVGQRFDRGEIYLPELILAADAMKAAVTICESAIPKEDLKVKKKVIMGTVAGDIHDIGKSIVCSFLSANGFEVYDLGREIPTETFVEKVREVDADVVGASALLTFTMDGQKQLVESLKEAGLRDKVKVIVGGAPVNQEWAASIGADGFAENAAAAVSLVKELTGVS